MKKKLLIAVGVVVLLVVVGIGAVFFFIDSIAKNAIERGGTYALGTKTTVSSVSVGVLSGKFSMSGLEVENPSGGFASKHFLKLGKGATEVSYATLRSPMVEIPSLTIDKLDANIERKGSATNYGAILESIKKVTGSDPAAPPGPKGTDEKKFIVHQLTLTNLTIHVDVDGSMLPGGLGGVVGGAVGSGGKIANLTIPIGKIELREVGKGQGGVADSGVTMSQLAGIIVKAVMDAAIREGQGLIPGEILNDLTGRLSSLANIDALTKGGISILGDPSKVLGEVGKIGGKVGDEVKKGVEEVTKGIGEGLKGILPGQKKPEPPPK